jgi:hypothetical protein
MFFRDHGPSHFHAEYGEYHITVDLADGVVQGRFPKRALRLVLEWYEVHKTDLEEDWTLATERKPLRPIPPLE